MSVAGLEDGLLVRVSSASGGASWVSFPGPPLPFPGPASIMGPDTGRRGPVARPDTDRRADPAPVEGASRLSPPARAFFLVFFVAVLGALTFPGVLIANREEPLVLGLPFFVFWVILWVVLSFLGQVALFILDSSNREERS